MKAVVDESCIGCTLCTQTCPEVFRMEDDHSVAYADPVPEGAEDDCRRAAEECPANAITIEE